MMLKSTELFVNLTNKVVVWSGFKGSTSHLGAESPVDLIVHVFGLWEKTRVNGERPREKISTVIFENTM